MNRFLEISQRILTILYKILKYVSVVLFSVVTLTITVQIFARYFFHKSWSWTDELARYCNIACVLFCGSLIMFQNEHVIVNFLDSILSPKVLRWVNAARMLIVTAFSGIMLLYSPAAVRMGLDSVSSNMQIPMYIVYSIFPITFFLLFVYSLFNILCYLFDRPLAFEEKKEAAENN